VKGDSLFVLFLLCSQTARRSDSRHAALLCFVSELVALNLQKSLQEFFFLFLFSYSSNPLCYFYIHTFDFYFYFCFMPSIRHAPYSCRTRNPDEPEVLFINQKKKRRKKIINDLAIILSSYLSNQRNAWIQWNFTEVLLSRRALKRSFLPEPFPWIFPFRPEAGSHEMSFKIMTVFREKKTRFYLRGAPIFSWTSKMIWNWCHIMCLKLQATSL